MRRLTLRREALAELTADELAGVAGAAEHTFPQVQCVVEEVERIWHTLATEALIPPTVLCK